MKGNDSLQETFTQFKAKTESRFEAIEAGMAQGVETAMDFETRLSALESLHGLAKQEGQDHPPSRFMKPTYVPAHSGSISRG